MKFYITYGNTHLFVGGWSLVHADSKEEAIHKLYKNHPTLCAVHVPNYYVFSSIYNEEEFKKTGMKTKGNFGRFQHEEIGGNA